MKNQPFTKADILIPNVEDLKKWSVVACDQFTSEPEYWQRVREFVGDSPSALNITLPEAYLESGGVDERIEKINSTMEEYDKKGVLTACENSCIYLERTLRSGKVRKGLIGVVDLEEYDYSKGSGSLIRATEGTILDRLPPRVKVRENALLELPHIILLFDDSLNTVFGSFDKDSLEKAYDFELMESSGAVRGYKVGPETVEIISRALGRLGRKDIFEAKYGVSGKDVLLFAVGDGNHSLATAKLCYENLKKTLPEHKAKSHPARYALVELENLHDETIEFEAIHRVMFDVDPDDVAARLYEYYDISPSGENGGQKITVCIRSDEKNMWIMDPSSNLPVGSLQKFIDDYISKYGGRVDYIHGDDVVRSLTKESGSNVGFLLEPMPKDELFKTVILDGALPRKTFSMGHAWDKRFYLEARKIK